MTETVLWAVILLHAMDSVKILPSRDTSSTLHTEWFHNWTTIEISKALTFPKKLLL